jgi:putative lipoprotein
MPADVESGLVGTAWRLDRLGDAPVHDAVRSTLTFGADGRVSGRGGVNRFGGAYRIAGPTIEFDQMMRTLMAGPPEAMAQEDGFLAVLAGIRPWSLDDGGGVLRVGDARLRRIELIRIAGRVSYRERIALPPGAVLVVGVLSESGADAAPVTVAEQRVEVEHQVPIPFEISVDPDDLAPGRRYSVAARIEIDGSPAWTSGTSYPLAVDAPTELEINLVRTGR